MRLHRFFTGSNINKGIVNTLSSEALAHQLRSVFRFHEGSQAIFFDGTGTDYVSEIVALTRDSVTFRILEERLVKRYSGLKLALAFSLIKKDNAEWVIEKGTELGVSEFIPLVSDRSEKKGFNMERAQRKIVEACEQSGRAELPTISEPQALAEYLDAEKRQVAVFHTGEGAQTLSSLPTEGELVACIGSEGGWTDAEIDLFKEKGATIVKLDSSVLRAETAAVAIAALLLIK